MKKQEEQCNRESKKKGHIVTWTQEFQEDDILREQIGIHGTENWAIIASKFKDKTTRQCRRRWYTYLNSDFKKGGWSPEEDLLLCEAQKLYGNRWTEIAKVVSGRTDNAVKNRFSTLCRKRQKYEALAKENSISSHINSNNKKIVFQHAYNTDATSESAISIKKMRRAHITDDGGKIKFGDRSHLRNGTSINQHPRTPFAVLAQNSQNINNLLDELQICNAKFSSSAQNNKTQGTFLKRDDPKIDALMQQAELLSSLAQNIDTEDMDQSLENTWKVLQEFLNRTKEANNPKCKIQGLKLADLKNMVEDLSSNEGGQPCWRQMDLYEDSPASSEYSTGSTILPLSAGDIMEHSSHRDIETEMKTTQIEDKKEADGCERGVLVTATLDQDMLLNSEEQINNDSAVSASSRVEFGSPVQVTPIFRSLAAGIPSPEFSESERNFLRKTLGVESPSLNPSAQPSQPPPCKRALLDSLQS
ncbi:transcription factor MYB88 isoform X2 [Arachis hypogaea]|uniref:transcription factor MYB88 isoform X2 n=1 Tax=Arachis hypogaea TaxID=3818 RepID=UPI0010FC5CB2|nr:transcription factor MYB88 isoform X2 [Arachis hypogaea]